MKRFFTSPAETKKSESERKKRKKIIREFNEEINKIIDDCIKENYEQTRKDLKEINYSDEEIEQFLTEFKQNMQKKIFEEYKEKLKEAAMKRHADDISKSHGSKPSGNI